MITKNGASCLSSSYPEKLKYFKEEYTCQHICLPKDKPDIEDIIDVFIHPEVVDLRLVETKNGLSNEGQKLTGNKIVAQVKINQKITYIADDACKSVCAIHYEMLKSIFIILPEFVEDKKICDMFKSSRIVINPFIEHTDTKKLDKRSFNTCVLLLLDAQIC